MNDIFFIKCGKYKELILSNKEIALSLSLSRVLGSFSILTFDDVFLNMLVLSQYLFCCQMFTIHQMNVDHRECGVQFIPFGPLRTTASHTRFDDI